MTEPISPALAGVSLITLAVAMFGPHAGPYFVILFGSLGGGMWALSSAEVKATTRVGRILEGAWLLGRCAFTAIVLTALIAGVVGPWFGVAVLEVYAVVAFVIGALGNQWLEIIATIKDRLKALIAMQGGTKK